MKHDTDSAAGKLGVKRKTLENWRSLGKGPAFHKVGGKVLYEESELDAWLQTCRRTSTSQQKQQSA